MILVIFNVGPKKHIKKEKKRLKIHETCALQLQRVLEGRNRELTGTKSFVAVFFRRGFFPTT